MKDGEVVCRMCGADCVAHLATVHGFDFVECGRCAFVFCPAIDGSRVADLYADTYVGPQGFTPEAGWADDLFLRFLEELLGGYEPRRVLDFGAGQSNLPDRLREVGHRVISVDMFPPRQPHPDRLTGALRELKLEANQFDLAYSYQVFEHLPHPAPELDELFRLTRPGAYVVIHTDMETDDRAGGFADWWYVMPPDHCCFFRHRTFKQYLQNTPHRLVAGTPHLVVMSKGQTGAMR